jgi:hypothetical protein
MRVTTAIGIVMVHQFVHIAAHHFAALKAKRIHGRPIDKCAIALQIKSTDAFTRRVQQRLPLLHLSLCMYSRHGHLTNPHPYSP